MVRRHPRGSRAAAEEARSEKRTAPDAPTRSRLATAAHIFGDVGGQNGSDARHRARLILVVPLLALRRGRAAHGDVRDCAQQTDNKAVAERGLNYAGCQDSQFPYSRSPGLAALLHALR